MSNENIGGAGPTLPTASYRGLMHKILRDKFYRAIYSYRDYPRHMATLSFRVKNHHYFNKLMINAAGLNGVLDNIHIHHRKVSCSDVRNA